MANDSFRGRTTETTSHCGDLQVTAAWRWDKPSGSGIQIAVADAGSVGYVSHFPMQKRLKMRSSTSSV
jgi:hypothetical protein